MSDVYKIEYTWSFGNVQTRTTFPDGTQTTRGNIYGEPSYLAVDADQLPSDGPSISVSEEGLRVNWPNGST